jgi:hypothetical protein
MVGFVAGSSDVQMTVPVADAPTSIRRRLRGALPAAERDPIA